MIYLANPAGGSVFAAMEAGHIGLLDTPGQHGKRPRRARETGAPWAADNGCFGDSWPGEDKWLAWLESVAPWAATCLFATAPDVVGDAAATLERSAPWFEVIRRLGFPAALVGQDGLEDLPIPWDDFDAFFIGGTDEWKLGPAAARLAREAKARGKHVHMGRVNSARRWDYADFIGCDSVDGTLLVFGPDTNLPRLMRWRLRSQTHLDWDLT